LYMSPEQARGEESLDHRVDIWALGVMLYECLTGEVPFHANNYLQIISQVLTRDPLPPSRLRPELGIPAAVETVVMRAMEKDRDRRYQTMADLERDLDRLLAGDQNVGLPAGAAPPPSADVAGGGRGRWHVLMAGAIVVAAGLAVALRHSGEGASQSASAGVAAPVVPPPARAP